MQEKHLTSHRKKDRLPERQSCIQTAVCRKYIWTQQIWDIHFSF